MTAGLPIIDTPSSLTPGWLTSALGIDGATVTQMQLEPVGTGQMCDSFRVLLTYDGDAPERAPRSVIVKQPAADPQSRETGKALRAYEAEVRFYQELAPTLPVRTPHVHHADIDVETGSFVMVMEDMAPARQGDQLSGCSVADATIALDELVKLHAPRWGDPWLAELDWLTRDPDSSRQFLAMMLPVFWDGFTERYADRLGDEVHTVGSAIIKGLDGYLERPPIERLTVAHGDYRLDNLLFGPPGGVPVAVVDWQTVTHGSALNDVAYFIGAGLLAEDRRANEDALVRRYHAAITDAGVTSYPWDMCWEYYRRGTFSGLVMAIAASMLVERTDRGDDMFMTMAHRHARHALDLDAPALLES